MDDVRKVVKEFMKENGNEKFTTKELVIYFNKEHKEDVKRLYKKINSLPCVDADKRIQKLETTNGIFKKILIVMIPVVVAIALRLIEVST